MITKQHADYLLDLPKHIVEQDKFLDRKSYSPSLPLEDRLYMASKSDDELTFFLDIKQSSKKRLKITLHFQEEDAKYSFIKS